jgi:flagellar biosynthetic protein FlhB
MPEESGEKTHEATPYRRQQAREEGQIAYSQDLGAALMLVVGAGLLLAWGGDLVDKLALLVREQLRGGYALAAAREDAVAQLLRHAQHVVAQLGPLLGVLLVASVLASVLQTGILWVPDRLGADLQRINPYAGLQRIFSLQGVMRLIFGLFKVLIVVVAGGAAVRRRWEDVAFCSDLEPSQLAVLTGEITLETALWVGGALLVLAVLDYTFQRWQHEQDLRMTHQEIREEMKNLQGDPQVIARRRAIQRQLAMHRVADKVPRADVVVTNPTELAVAIQYDPEKMATPIVVAKGAGVIAQRIRRLALEHEIPIVERKPLAQLLYKEVEVGRPIPDESYAAVAEVLAYVYRLKGKTAPAPRAA